MAGTIWLYELAQDEAARIRAVLERRNLQPRVIRALTQAEPGDVLIYGHTIPFRQPCATIAFRPPIAVEQFLQEIQEKLAATPVGPGLVGTHPRIEHTRTLLARYARFPQATVLLTGETGTGKTHAARFLHEQQHGPTHAPFVEVNCAGLPEHLLDSTLFGYSKGAFTGALGDTAGLIEAAEGGTLFLDEIEAMSMSLQGKLLTLLESRCYRRVGETETRSTTARIVCASNQNLDMLVRTKRLRSDLYFRINSLTCAMPALREIPDVIPELAEHFRRLLSQRHQLESTPFPPSVVTRLQEYSWPGNARELRNVVERLLILDELSLDPAIDTVEDVIVLPTHLTLDEVSARYLAHVSALSGSTNQDVLAQRLGISRKTLYNLRQRHAV